MKKIKFYLLPFLLLFIFMTLTACGVNTKKNTWQKIEESKTITIGYEADFAPLTSKQESGKPEGFNIALAEAIFASYNIKIDWKALDWSAKEKALKEGKRSYLTMFPGSLHHRLALDRQKRQPEEYQKAQRQPTLKLVRKSFTGTENGSKCNLTGRFCAR